MFDSAAGQLMAWRKPGDNWEPPEDDEEAARLVEQEEFLQHLGARNLGDGTFAILIGGEAERDRNM